MIGTRTAARVLLLALIAVAAGCDLISIRDPMHYQDDFMENMKTFTQYVRWGNFTGAANYVVDDQKDAFLELAPELSDVRFTDYEILRQDLNEARDAATVDVVFTGYRLSSPISRTMRLHQVWKRVGTYEWRVRVELEPLRQALGLAAD